MDILIAVDSLTSVGRFFTLIVIFLFVLFVCYATTRYIANFQKGQMQGSNIKLRDAIRLSSNKYIQLVEIGDKYIALAVCKDTVTKIAEFDKDELELKENQMGGSFNFKEIFDRVKRSKDEDSLGQIENDTRDVKED